MKFENRAEAHRRVDCLGAIDTLGSFDFYTLIASLDSLTRESLRYPVDHVRNALDSGGALNPDTYTFMKGILPLAHHEYTHFIDTTSTLWGQRHLQRMNRAYLAGRRELENGEADFHLGKAFFDATRCIRLPKYYTVVNPNVPDGRPWQAQPTMGKLFAGDGTLSKRNVLFIRFLNAADEPLVRCPISTVSILEASAVAQELEMKWVLMARLAEDERLVEQAHEGAAFLRYIYNKNLTEYSVCAHVVANHLACTDAAATYALCAALTRIVLNFPKSAYVEVVQRWDSTMHHLQWAVDSPMSVSLKSAAVQEDMGSLFYLLAQLLPTNAHASPEAREQGVRSAVEALGLDLPTLRGTAAEEIDVIQRELDVTPILPLRTIAVAGRRNFEAIGWSTRMLHFSSLHLPPLLLGDDSAFGPYDAEDNELSTLDLEETHAELVGGQIWVERFAEACV